jgi:phage gp29-like protein
MVMRRLFSRGFMQSLRGPSIAQRQIAAGKEFAETVEAIRVANRELMMGSPYFQGMLKDTYPYYTQNELASKKGIKVFRRMQDEDDMVSASVAYRQFAALSTGWEIEPASDQPVDIEVADFIKDALEALPGSVQQLLLGISDAIPIGFSVAEKVWGDVMTEGKWKGKRWYRRIARRNPVQILFKPNMHGELLDDGIWQENREAPTGYIHIPTQKCIYHVPNPRDDHPYGWPPSMQAYRYAFWKEGTILLYARTTEKHGLPLFQVKAPLNANPEDVQEMKDVLNGLRDSIHFISKPGWELVMHEVKIGSHRIFIDALAEQNRGISRSYLLPSLVFENSETGAYALGTEHADQFSWILESDRIEDTETLNNQFIHDLVKVNFAVSEFPRFKFKDFAKDDVAAKGELAKMATEIGFPLSVKWLRDTFGAPAPMDEEDTFIPTHQAPSAIPGMTEEARQEYTEILNDAAYGKLGPRRLIMHAPGSNGGTTFAARNLEDVTGVDEIDRQGESAWNRWQDIVGVTIDGIAAEAERLEGKGPGAHRLR